jgi:16S rRNA (cytosine967-C5)-methyltransferase
MKYSSIVGHAAEALESVLRGTRPADVTVQEFFRARRYLGARDRRVIAEMVYDALRRLRILGVLAAAATGRAGGEGAPGPALPLLLVQAAVIRREELPRLREGFEALWTMFIRTPPLEEAVRAVAEAETRLVPPSDPVERLSLEHSLPRGVVRDWLGRFGEEQAALLCAASNVPAPVTVRVNTLRCTVQECLDALAAEGVQAAPTARSPVGLTLSKRMYATGLRTFRMGWFEMQDEGSQLISMLVHPRPGWTVVDACAGAGGKALHLAALMGNCGRIVALDVSAERLGHLRERTARAGVSIVSTGKPGGSEAAGLAGAADAVLVDAPCSGTGTFRRNPGAKAHYTDEVVTHLVRTQARVLESSAAMVRPGGTLVYATCSLLHRENGDQVDRFLVAHPDFRRVSAPAILAAQGAGRQDPGTEERPLMLELLPHVTGTDGYFAAVLERAC